MALRIIVIGAHIRVFIIMRSVEIGVGKRVEPGGFTDGPEGQEFIAALAKGLQRRQARHAPCQRQQTHAERQPIGVPCPARSGSPAAGGIEDLGDVADMDGDLVAQAPRTRLHDLDLVFQRKDFGRAQSQWP